MKLSRSDSAILPVTRRECLRALGGLALPLLTPAGVAAANAGWHVTGHEVPELLAFDHAVEQFMRGRGIRAGGLAVTRHDRLLLARGYTLDDTPDAEVEPASLFRIASLSKPVTAAVVMRLVQEDRLRLDARVFDIVPLQPARARYDARLDHVTVLHLLQHLGGWDRERTFDPLFHDAAISRSLRVGLPIDVDHIVAFMAGRPVDYPPGTAYHYSNFGYLLLGQVIERVTGASYEDAARDTLLRPLGIERMRLGRTLPALRADGEVIYQSAVTTATVMDGSGRRVPAPYGGFNLENLGPAGGWLASPVDLARLATMLGGPAAGREVLHPTTIDRMLAPPETGANPNGQYYGCGWMVRPRGAARTAWHTGSAPGTTAELVRRSDGIGWAVVFNGRDDRDPSAWIADIDNRLGAAATSVVRWPTHDLFDESTA